MEPTDQEIYRLLYRLGITANYAGFFHLAHALRLCAEKPDRLLLVTKLVYPEVAKAYRTNWKAVERNIRTVTTAAWAQGSRNGRRWRADRCPASPAPPSCWPF